MISCQDGDVRSRARIVELSAMATAAAIFATSALTVETVETVETLSAPIEQQVLDEVKKEAAAVESRVEEVEQQVLDEVKEEAAVEGRVEEALLEAETWSPPVSPAQPPSGG